MLRFLTVIVNVIWSVSIYILLTGETGFITDILGGLGVHITITQTEVVEQDPHVFTPEERQNIVDQLVTLEDKKRVDTMELDSIEDVSPGDLILVIHRDEVTGYELTRHTTIDGVCPDECLYKEKNGKAN